ncbi:hypothetical protein BaRGS_00024495 [Batillaria attramentaria]|uniref:RING-type domain-containing protein n=1 Tax=Batillaria attramentaria TaxID=370345 RepID=A0ABD0KAW0_9CAEN
MASGGGEEEISAAVEAVTELGYTREQVLDVYRQMASGHPESHRTSEGRNSTTSSSDRSHQSQRAGKDVISGNSSHVTSCGGTPSIGAASLLLAVDAIHGGLILAGERSRDSEYLTERLHHPYTEDAATFTSFRDQGESGEELKETLGFDGEENKVEDDTMTDRCSSRVAVPDNMQGVQPTPVTSNMASASGETTASATEEIKENVSPKSCADRDAKAMDKREGTQSGARERTRRLRQKVRVLTIENRRLKERQTCRHCRERPVSLTLLPCGHFCFCQECGATFHACPVCRKTILADVRTIVS